MVWSELLMKYRYNFSTSSRTFFQRSRCHLVTEIWVHIAFLYQMRCKSWNLISSKINWHANCLPPLEVQANGCYSPRSNEAFPFIIMVFKNMLSTRISWLDHVKVPVASISWTQHFRFGNYFRHYYYCCRHQLTQFCKAGPSYWKQMSFLARKNSSSKKSSLNSLSSWDFYQKVIVTFWTWSVLSYLVTREIEPNCGACCPRGSVSLY